MMKKRSLISLLLVVCLLLPAAAIRAATDTEEITNGCFYLEIPSYYSYAGNEDNFAKYGNSENTSVICIASSSAGDLFTYDADDEELLEALVKECKNQLFSDAGKQEEELFDTPCGPGIIIRYGLTSNGIKVEIDMAAILCEGQDSVMLALCLINTSSTKASQYRSDFTAMMNGVQTTPHKSTKKGSSSSSPDGVTPAFKKTMDEYEKYFDDCIESMKSGKSSAMLSAYMDLLNLIEELEELEDTAMTAADSAYYLEVMARIMVKLASVQ